MPAKGVKQNMREHKLGSGVNWQGALKQKSIKQMGVKKKGLAYRHAVLDFTEQPTLEGSMFSANPKFSVSYGTQSFIPFSQEPTTCPHPESDESSLRLLINFL